MPGQRGLHLAADDLPLTILKLPTVDPTVTSARAKALVFEDVRSRELLRLIQRMVPSQATVLVTGETGTGKEIVARHLHELSARREGPFLAINCGAFSETLVESELFGHEKGAFTGASSTRAGWFEAANLADAVAAGRSRAARASPTPRASRVRPTTGAPSSEGPQT